jgi:hypothetical protein
MRFLSYKGALARGFYCVEKWKDLQVIKHINLKVIPLADLEGPI